VTRWAEWDVDLDGALAWVSAGVAVLPSQFDCRPYRGEQSMRDDPDPVETQEWLSALASVVEFEGVDRASSLLDELLSEGRSRGVPVPHPANTP
jgi:hypothetical protein